MFDDAGDPNTSLQQVQEVVNGGHTLAAVPVLTASMNGFNTLNDAGMPFFGWGITTGYCGPMAFSFSGAVCEKATEGNNTMAILAQALPNNGKDARVAIIAQEDQSAQEAARRAADSWTGLGAKVVLQEASVPSPPAVVSDWTPYATSIIDSGADFALLPLSAINTIGLASKLKELGFKGTIATFVMYDPRIAALAKDTLVVLSTAPWEQTDAPGIAQAIADLKKYAPDTALNLPSLAGWLAADQFVSLLESVGPELNRGTFNAAIKSFTYDFGGAAGPVRNPDTQEHLSGCNSVVRGTGTGYEVVVRYTCLPLIPF
jgi:ABC-type branched-subunit amino acid transport system substrate-binding protein